MSKIRTYESNSQLSSLNGVGKNSCSWCQRYELMRAIHNYPVLIGKSDSVVPDVKDTNLWEQFTTWTSHQREHPCCSWCQRYELMRAIHNRLLRLTPCRTVVPDVKDTNLWEQFTTPASLALPWMELFLMSKIRTYESNSQHPFHIVVITIGCSWCQRYELMRAIHNDKQ